MKRFDEVKFRVDEPASEGGRSVDGGQEERQKTASALLWIGRELGSQISVLIDRSLEVEKLLAHALRSQVLARWLSRLCTRCRVHEVEDLLLYRRQSSAAARPSNGQGRSHRSGKEGELNTQEPPILVLLCKVIGILPRRKLCSVLRAVLVVRPILNGDTCASLALAVGGGRLILKLDRLVGLGIKRGRLELAFVRCTGGSSGLRERGTL